MDPKLKEKYLDCGGTFCPFCGSDDIAHSEVGLVGHGGTVTEDKCCNTCCEEWYDLFELKEVRYVPGDDRANEEVPVPASSSPAERDRARRE